MGKRRWTAAEMGRKGGKRRAATTSAARLSEIGKAANAARWKGLTLAERQAGTAKARAARVKKGKGGK